MSLIINNSENLALVATELDNLFEQSFRNRVVAPDQATATSGDVFKSFNWDKGAYYEETYAPVGLYEETAELGDNSQDRVYAANKRSVLPVTFTKEVQLSKEWFDDSMYNVYGRMISDMATKAYVSQDFQAFGIFRGAFTSVLTNDGVPFVSTAHPLIKGGTISNRVLNNPALTVAGFEAAKNQLQVQKDQSGVIIGHYPKFLLVPINLHTLATQIVNSSLIQGSNNNDINVYKSAYGIMVKTTPYMGAGQADGTGSDTAWFLMSDAHSVQRLVRQGLETRLVDWQYSSNRKYRYMANYRESYFVSDYSGVVASLGDGTLG